MEDDATVEQLQEQIQQLKAMLDLFELDREWEVEKLVEKKLKAEYERGISDGSSSGRKLMYIDAIVSEVKTELQNKLPQVIADAIPADIRHRISHPHPRIQMNHYQDPMAFQTRIQTDIVIPETRIRLMTAISDDELTRQRF